MKTPQEFLDSCQLAPGIWNGDVKSLIEQRDAEHRAELDTAESRVTRLVGDVANMADEIERLRGELVEALRALTEIQDCTNECYLCDDHRDAPQLGGAPPPAESTPVPASRETPVRCVKCMGTKIDRKGRECRYCSWKPQPAPPDDIRLEESLINRIAEAKSYVLGQVGRVERVFAAHSEEAYRRLADHERRLAALEAKDSDRCARADCGRPRHWGGHEGHHEFVAALEAKGEPGTVFCDEHGREDCGRPDHPKGAKP